MAFGSSPYALLVVLVSGLVHCAGPATHRAAAVHASAASSAMVVSIEVCAQARGSDEWHPLGPEDTLHSGDRYALKVHNTQPAFLYVARGETEQPSEYLLPKDLRAPIKRSADAESAVPEVGFGIELGPQTGEENVFVAASEVPLTADQLKDVMSSAPAGVLGKGRERPPDPNSRTRPSNQRGIVSPVYTAKAVSPGIYALRFTFQHQQ